MTYPGGRSWRRRSRGVPCRSSATVSREPSPIERTRRQSVSPRQASRGQAGLKPAATSSRHSWKTGAYPRALRPAASQRSEPMSAARIGACANILGDVASAMTCRPSWSLPEAPCARPAPGLLGYSQVVVFVTCKAGSCRSQASASSWLITVRLPILRPRSRPALSSSYALVRPMA